MDPLIQSGPDAWPAITLESAGTLLDLSGGRAAKEIGGTTELSEGQDVWSAIGEQQLAGAVDLYARLGAQRIAWLSDEVGLGKTYVAMAVAALVRHQHPNARILYLLPTTRLLPKWKRELGGFSRKCVRNVDHHLRTLEGGAARPLVECATMHELAVEATLDPDRDFLCTLGAFSFGLDNVQEAIQATHKLPSWESQWKRLLSLFPGEQSAPGDSEGNAPPSWEELKAKLVGLEANKAKRRFKQGYAEVLNRVMPTFDLVICDEAHNLKGGLASGASRNLTLSLLLGGITPTEPICTYKVEPKAKRVLCLTATPFSRSFAEITRQAEVFGFHTKGWGVERAPVIHTLNLLATSTEPSVIRKAAKSLIVRRLGELQPKGETESRTRNQYREEHRAGGMDEPHKPLEEPSLWGQLVLAVVQKRVFDALTQDKEAKGDDGPPNLRFQMGVLSSFESFSQSLDTQQNDKNQPLHEGEVKEEARKDAEKEANALDKLMASYDHAFPEPLPHPKMAAVAVAVADAALNGEKSLVFVRRVRTTDELARQVARQLDKSLLKYILEELPSDAQKDWREVWGEYIEWAKTSDAKRLRLVTEPMAANSTTTAPLDKAEVPSLFSWYFRMSTVQPKRFTSGDGSDKAKSTSHAGVGGLFTTVTLNDGKTGWPALLGDNLILALFGQDKSAVDAWARNHIRCLRQLAPAYAGVKRTDGGKRKGLKANHTAWFDGYQAAALTVLSTDTSEPEWRQRTAGAALGMHFPTRLKESPPIDKSPSDKAIVAWLTLPTLFAQLSATNTKDLAAELWPHHRLDDGKASAASETAGAAKLSAYLHRRERERLILLQLLRNGLSYLDLWLAVVSAQGGLRRSHVDVSRATGLRGHATSPTMEKIGKAWVSRLSAQRDSADFRGFSSYRELREAAKHHDLIIDQNFPDVERSSFRAAELRFRAVLGSQGPVVALHGKSKSVRAMQQFRMPGFPLVMVATSVVQEGVDLHTFCSRVVHYGIDGTSTGTEQRNGRVDRRGSLIERKLMTEGHNNERIQVYFPHLRRSLEPLQLATLYRRMNRFLKMAHDITLADANTEDEWVQTAQAVIQHASRFPEPYKERLITVFPAHTPLELRGAAECIRALPSLPTAPPSLDAITKTLADKHGWSLEPQPQLGLWRGLALLPNQRKQPFELTWRSGTLPAAVLEETNANTPCWPLCLRIESPIRPYNLDKMPPDQHRVLQGWSRPGLSLLARKRSRELWELWTRADLHLSNNADLPNPEAFISWLEWCLEQTDTLEQRLAPSNDPDKPNPKDHAAEDFA